MRKYLIIIIIFFIRTNFLIAQSEYILNPSFEGLIGMNNIPNNWYSCNNLSTPDTRPYFNDFFQQTDGKSYIGLVMRGLMDPMPKNEDVLTKLIKPIYRDSTYYVSIDAVFVPYEFDNLPDTILYYNHPCRIKISGGNDSCLMNEILAVSELITDSSWKRLYFQIKPTTDSCIYLKIEIYLEPMRASYIGLDNLRFDELKIFGENRLCQGRKNVMYYIPDIQCATNFNWVYSGAGATIIGNSDTILINFDSTATSGILSMSFNNCGQSTDTLFLPISIDTPSPTDPGKIIGLTEVCPNQNMVIYYTADTNHYKYIWSYSGDGASITENFDSVIINFSHDAVSGILKATGESTCISYLPVTVIPLPSGGGGIIGDFELCSNQKEAVFSIPKMDNAIDYQWNFNGSGVSIIGTSDSISINIAPDAQAGVLSVMGKNICGTSTQAYYKFLNFEQVPQDTPIIIGRNEICLNNSTESFYAIIPYATDYVWNYDGTGATLSGSYGSVDIQFSNNASNGNLTVIGSNRCGTGLMSPEFAITFYPLPSPAGDIIGEHEICENAKEVIYKVPEIENAINYLWYYNGYGSISGLYSNSVRIDFYQDASNGNLLVAGENQCGTGLASKPFNISVETVPNAPKIIGSREICANSNNIFIAQSFDNIINYNWSYSGDGAIFQNNNDTLILNLSKIQNSGFLTVTGSNRCGTSEVSMPMPIEVRLCDIHIPNTFTPNEDGINDLFFIRGLVDNTKLVVFDRYGKLVYETENYQNDWNGINLNNEKLPSDTYWYVITINGIETEYKGFIYLKR